MLTSEKLAEDGGPAFPCHNDESVQYNWIWRGMTLRDYLAAKAMVAFIGKVGDEDISFRAYQLADQMLEQREL